MSDPAADKPAAPVVAESKPGPSHDADSAAQAVSDLTLPGVERVRALSQAITKTDRIVIFLGVFLIAYVYGLDGTLRYSYQPTATDDFGQHSVSSTVNVLRAVIAAAAQPTSAKIADVFGRVELLCLSVFFYVLGTIIEAVATNVATFAGGSVVYQIGYTMVILLVEVIIADITSTRARLFFSYIPALPFIINTWVSGDIAAAVLANTTWHWGIGMFCIIYTVCAMPLILSLWFVGRRAKKQGLLTDYRSSFQILGFNKFAVHLFWLLDVPGLILVIAVFALLLVPLTLAGGFEASWSAPHVVAPLVIGFVCIPIFILWELRAPHPLVPFRLMKDRSVWAPMGIALFLNFSWYMQADFLYTVLIVAFDFSITLATRTTSLYSFVSVIVGPLIGLVAYKIRRLKIFIVAGTALFMLALGLMIHYRGGTGQDNRIGLIAAQVLLGVGGGLFPYTAQASLQVHLKHEHLAVMTGLYLATYNVGSALGNAVSGALWTQVLPARLETSLRDINSTLAAQVYASPLTAIVDYPVGTPERDAVIDAYREIQRLLTITGICLSVFLVVFGFLTRNPKLTDAQTLANESESDAEREQPPTEPQTTEKLA
ncbi:major facilitator superfamily domain-containing protein [Stachybotrys elegans]|uniref:Major facilitator superfamily domain-containing protein n=1 Tax=Stachybotrys elegans TaxID=80388 RepID=A0A8K0SZH3_9HYPO|nr:major facilitator superfamily domain-containing protein [Stachybotrys elegans]